MMSSKRCVGGGAGLALPLPGKAGSPSCLGSQGGAWAASPAGAEELQPHAAACKLAAPS